MRPTNKSNPLSKSSGPLSDVSRRAVANILKRVKSREVQRSKLKNSYRNQCDVVDEQKSSVETKIRHNADRGKNILQPQSEEEEEEEDESIWEDWPFPTSSSTNTHKNDVVNEFAIEFEEEMPDSVKKKIIRRATAEDKELAELVHKVHLLCLLARGRLIDSACDDLLIQASFHSLIPHSFMRISNTTDLKVADLIPLVRWIHDTFRVRSPSNSKKSILSALQFALGNKEGTAEEVTALSVALFRALNFTTRFVTILNVAIGVTLGVTLWLRQGDDFLPRTATPLEDIFRSVFCLPCLMFAICLRDTFVPDGGKLRDPRRLYAPGRMYHIVERKFCRCGRYPPEVKTAIPVDGRFEHIVLSCNATSDHAIIWIERESEKALENMQDNQGETTTTAPKIQKMERLQSLEKEHKDAIERAVSLNIPHAESLSGEEPSTSKEDESVEFEVIESSESDSRKPKLASVDGRTNWDTVVQKLFKKTDSELLLNKDFIDPS